MIKLLQVLILVLMMQGVLVIPAAAQSKPLAKPGKDTAMGPLKLFPKLGPFGDSSKVLVSVAKQLVHTPLKVIDNKGGTYQVVAFTFAWRKKDSTDNLKTGASSIIFTYNATSILGTDTIPATWQQELKAFMQPKEEILFDEILVQHLKTKKLIKGPSLRLLLL